MTTPDKTVQAIRAESEPNEVQVPPKRTSFGLQALQLVVIPALIVVACISMAALFGMMAGSKDNIDTHLMKLQQSSGAGKIGLGLQDPRYKDRGLAAYNIATMIPKITDPQEKYRISSALLKILNDHVGDNEWTLRSYLLMALGQLGQDGGLEAIMQGLQSPHPPVRQSAIGGLLSWPEAQAARIGVASLLDRLKDDNPAVRAAATAALGKLAPTGDQHVIECLKSAMEDSIGLPMREVRWNAAVALAKLGDTGGSRFVATVLLDRSALGQMAAGESGPITQQKMALNMQDRIMLAVMASLATVQDPSIWDKIGKIADNDPSLAVKNAARQLVMAR